MAWWNKADKPEPMRFLDWFIYGYLAGYLFFFTCIEFGVSKFDNIFFLWNNLFYGSIGAWLSLYFTGSAVVKAKVKYPLIFSCIMYGWELIVFFTGWDVNNPWAVMVCFIAVLIPIGYLMFREFKRLDKIV